MKFLCGSTILNDLTSIIILKAFRIWLCWVILFWDHKDRDLKKNMFDLMSFITRKCRE